MAFFPEVAINFGQMRALVSPFRLKQSGCSRGRRGFRGDVPPSFREHSCHPLKRCTTASARSGFPGQAAEIGG